jgi:hypothetical protein
MNQTIVAVVDVAYWHKPDMPQWSLYVRSWGQSGKHLLGLSFSAFDLSRKWCVHRSSTVAALARGCQVKHALRLVSGVETAHVDDC